jgi:hypothetical protein
MFKLPIVSPCTVSAASSKVRCASYTNCSHLVNSPTLDCASVHAVSLENSNNGNWFGDLGQVINEALHNLKLNTTDSHFESKVYSTLTFK